MAAKFPSVVCSRTVRSNQHALQCDQCQKWQHRVCNTDFTRQQYLDIVSGELDLPSWYCANCSTAESTRLSSGIAFRLRDEYSLVFYVFFFLHFQPLCLASLSGLDSSDESESLSEDNYSSDDDKTKVG